jgi:glycosyltransferase involved in cell wall biosynthesis
VRLPVSIVSPVRDCASAMPAHAAHLRKLAEVADEIIVVDSDSTDGTLEILKKELEGLGVIFLNHPPGLYQSWNFGIAAATQPYCTVASVGDNLPVESLRKLTATMERFEADVVVSAPLMIADGDQASKRIWPIHRVITAAKITEPREISGAAWLAITLGYFPASLISSSAGNLYRTKLLQENPFPTEFGHAGDCAWALQMSRVAKWVIDPTVKSYFWVHAVSAHRKKRSEDRAKAMNRMVNGLFADSENFLREHGVPNELLDLLRQASDQMLEKAMLQIRYAEIRRKVLPWFLHPESVRVKRGRKSIEAKIQHRLAETLRFAASLSP